MPIRDVVLTLIVFGGLPFILRKPSVGVLMWSWLSYMNPHRLTWSFAYNMPFAQIVGITLLTSVLLSKEPKRLPINGLMVTWALFIAWMTVTTTLAIYPDFAWPYFIQIMKIQIPIFIALMIMQSRERIIQMIWVIYLSIGFFGIKGGIFTLLTAGGHRVYGPPGSMIGDNNALATALLIILPLGYFLYQHTQNPWVRRGLLASMLLIAASVVGSYSRGAFLAGFCIAFFLWLRTRTKVLTGVVLLTLLPLLFTFMPESWHSRMDTIQNYKQDDSAMGRINAWTYSFNVANDRLTGAGLQSWTRETFALWAPNPNDVKVAHSIYFSVLADHGWIGLALFLSILWMAWRLCSRVIRQSRDRDDLRWMNNLAKMVQLCFVAYGTGGAFLSLSYFDLPWHLIAITVLLSEYLKVENRKAKPISDDSATLGNGSVNPPIVGSGAVARR